MAVKIPLEPHPQGYPQRHGDDGLQTVPVPDDVQVLEHELGHAGKRQGNQKEGVE
ncbi:MAG: hypothetical protein JO087_15695 [Actinobacteria bacterium]|nr:hypothetical protein [Actinomycetota bacterium]